MGIYENPPLVSIDTTKTLPGISIDMLKVVAGERGWTLDFQAYSFADGLLALERGDIDLMPALAYSPYRDSVYLLNNTSVGTNWAKVYKHEDDDELYNSIEDLRNSKIGLLKGDYYVENGDDGLIDIFKELDIMADTSFYNSYDEIVKAIESEKIELGLLSRYYGFFETSNNDIVKTPINVAYVSLRYGFYRTAENEIIAAQLDETIQGLINNRNSIYYQLEESYMAFKGISYIPGWLWQTFGIVMLGITTLAIFTILLQYQVKRKTGELKETNRMLARSEQEARLAAQTIEASQDIGFWFVPGRPFINVNKAACRLTGYSKDEMLAMIPRELFSTDKNMALYDRIREGNWDGHLLIEDELRRKDGSVFPVEISLDEFSLDGNTYICGFARNITERVRAENELIEKNKELTCLYAINQLTADRELRVEEIFDRAIGLIPIAWQYPELTVVRIDVHNKTYASPKYAETPWQLRADILEADTKVGEIIIGYLKQPDGLKDPFLIEENNLISAIAREFSDMLTTRYSDRRIMSKILSTEDKERSRISKELHDSVGQTLTAISLHLEAMSKLKALSEIEKKKLKEVEDLVKNAIGESRSVSHNLMPPALTDLGFTYAVENIIDSVADVSQTKFEFQSNTNEIKIDKEIEFALFRIVQEAVNNIIKYSEATEASIQYIVYEKDISLFIEDNGIGFDMQIAEKKHNFGLNSMRNRVLSVGGEIEINSSPEHGTSIHIQVPIN